MNKDISIKGHRSRGNEVMEILEMLGGKITYKCGYKDGFNSSRYFFINREKNSSIDYYLYNNEKLENYYVFTIEDFLKKFPYKVGDKVKHNGEVKEIIEAKWSKFRNTVVYTIKGINSVIDCYDCKFLYPYKKEEKIEETPIDYIKESNDIYRIVLNHQFDMVVDEGEYYAIKRKPKYPNTINECYNSLEDDELVNNKLLYAFRDLIVARNAYWKIAGKQMGLSKPWEPDWKDFCESKYCIYITESEIKTGEFHNDNQILAFPTMEMCEEFLKNFGYIIEKCKDFFKI